MLRAKEKNVKFNEKKVQFKKTEVKYLGSLISQEGVKPDPSKVHAICAMSIPQNKHDLKRFLGMVNFLSSYIPDMSEKTAALRVLLKDDTLWTWDKPQEEAFETIKNSLTSAPVLKLYNSREPVALQVDASQNGLGAALLQDGKPVAYASRALSEAETRYAQIEKELLAIVFGAEKFYQYIYGRETEVQTDHKPLEAVFKKPLNKVTPRLQRMMLRLQRYGTDLKVRWLPGKELFIADTLSRATSENEPNNLEEELNYVVHSMVRDLAMSEGRKQEIKEATLADSALCKLMEFIRTEFPPHKSLVDSEVRELWNQKDQLHVADGILFCDQRVVIPPESGHIAQVA